MKRSVRHHFQFELWAYDIFDVATVKQQTATPRRRRSAAPEDSSCGLALDESLLDDEMAGLGMAAFSAAALFECLAQIFQHAGAAAQHDAVSLDVQRRQADVVEQLLRRDEVGDASPIAERLARHRGIIDKFLAHQRSKELIVAQARHQLLAVSQFGDLPAAVHQNDGLELVV